MAKGKNRLFIISLSCFLLLIIFKIFANFADDGMNMIEDSRKQPEQFVLNNSFKTGESIFFGVYSNGIRVGLGAMVYHGIVALNGQNVQHVSFTVSTFSVKDEEEVYGLLDFSAPVIVNRKIRLFGRDEIINEEYSPDKKTVRILKSVNGAAPVEQILNTQSEMNNVLLLIYSLRNKPDLRKGDSYRIILPTQSFDLKVINSRKIKVPLGRYDTYYLQSVPSKYRLWLNSGKDRLPVRIQGLVAGGMMYLAVTEVR